MHYNDSDTVGAHETVKVNDCGIPEWAQVLEPVRKLPTNVGARIRKCIYDALDKAPPEWARKRLEHSISKEVYKGNASGPTKVLISNIIFVKKGKNICALIILFNSLRWSIFPFFSELSTGHYHFLDANGNTNQSVF